MNLVTEKYDNGEYFIQTSNIGFSVKHEGSYFLVYPNTSNVNSSIHESVQQWVDRLNCRSMMKRLDMDTIVKSLRVQINNLIQSYESNKDNDSSSDLCSNGSCENVSIKNQSKYEEDVNITCIKEMNKTKQFVNESIKSTPYSRLTTNTDLGMQNPINITISDRYRCADVIVTDYVRVFRTFLEKKDKLSGTISLKNNCIYDWRVILHSAKKEVGEIVVDFKLHPDLHPHYPPSVNVVSPKFANDLNNRISRSKFTMLEYWSCDRSVSEIISRILQIVEKYGVVNAPLKVTSNKTLNPATTGILLEIESHLSSLASLCDVDEVDVIDTDQKFIKVADIIASKKDVKKRSKLHGDGTGYGNARSSVWDPNKYREMIQEKHNKIITLINSMVIKINRIMDIEGDVSCTTNMIKESTLLKYLIKHFKHTTVLEITNEASYYKAIFQFIQLYCLETTIDLFYDPNPENSLFTRICELHEKAALCLDIDESNENANMLNVMHSMIEIPYKNYVDTISMKLNKEKSSSVSTDKPSSRKIVKHMIHDEHDIEVDRSTTNGALITPTMQQQNNEFKHNYQELMKKYKHKFVEGLHDDPSYHYRNKVTHEDVIAMKQCYKRMSSEIPTLIESTSVHDNALVIIAVDKKRPNCIRYLLNGPIGTPYSRGLFIFDSYCSHQYPETSPGFQFVNTGGFRFNPNLYGDGKVCLSLLGTYAGPTPHESEKWNPKISTLSQVIVSIQAQIFVDHPYFNEPGYESRRGTQTGDRESKHYNESVRHSTMKAGMLDLIKYSESYPQFKSAIITHFYLQRDAIIEQCKAWISECASQETRKNMENVFEELQEVLLMLKLPE